MYSSTMQIVNLACFVCVMFSVNEFRYKHEHCWMNWDTGTKTWRHMPRRTKRRENVEMQIDKIEYGLCTLYIFILYLYFTTTATMQCIYKNIIHIFYSMMSRMWAILSLYSPNMIGVILIRSWCFVATLYLVQSVFLTLTIGRVI